MKMSVSVKGLPIAPFDDCGQPYARVEEGQSFSLHSHVRSLSLFLGRESHDGNSFNQESLRIRNQATSDWVALCLKFPSKSYRQDVFIALSMLPNLKELDLDVGDADNYDRVLATIPIWMPGICTLRLTNAYNSIYALSTLLEACPNLQVLEFEGFHSIGGISGDEKETLRETAKNFLEHPSLKHVEVANASITTSSLLEDLLDDIANLAYSTGTSMKLQHIDFTDMLFPYVSVAGFLCNSASANTKKCTVTRTGTRSSASKRQEFSNEQIEEKYLSAVESRYESHKKIDMQRMQLSGLFEDMPLPFFKAVGDRIEKIEHWVEHCQSPLVKTIAKAIEMGYLPVLQELTWSTYNRGCGNCKALAECSKDLRSAISRYGEDFVFEIQMQE